MPTLREQPPRTWSRGSPEQLLLTQREVFADRCDRLSASVQEADGFDRTLALWRLETTSATLRFTEAMLSDLGRAPAASSPRPAKAS